MMKPLIISILGPHAGESESSIIHRKKERRYSEFWLYFLDVSEDKVL